MTFNTLIARQRAFFQTGATRSQDFRQTQLVKLREVIEDQEQIILDALQADLHKSPHEAYASEIGLVISEIRHAIRHLPFG